MDGKIPISIDSHLPDPTLREAVNNTMTRVINGYTTEARQKINTSSHY